MNITKLTQDATLDNLSADDYQSIYDELRPFDVMLDKRTPSIRKFCEMVNWTMAPANWINWEQGNGNLTRAMRNALRRGVCLPELPMTVQDATAQASPDASVWMVGVGVPDTVVMVASQEPITLRVNGSVTVCDGMDAMPSRNAVERTEPRKKYIRPCATETQDADRIDIGASWNDVIDAGIQTLKRMRTYA